MVSHHYRIADGRAEIFRSPHRFVGPSELDPMAEPAHLLPSGRWANWEEAPFTPDSTSHVRVWRKP